MSALDTARAAHLVASQRLAAAWLAYDAALDAIDGVCYERSDAAHAALAEAHEEHRHAMAALLCADSYAKRPVHLVIRAIWVRRQREARV